MPILSEKKEEPQQTTKKGYWQNELDSLGIEPKQKKESLEHEKAFKVQLD